MKNLILPEKEEMTDEEKTLFLMDIKRVCEEYFEADGKYTFDLAKTEKGFSACIIFDALRVRKFKKPR